MSVRRADVRFALPQPARRAVVLDLPEWRKALSAAGVEVVASGDDADLVVAPARLAPQAAAAGAAMVLLEGRGGQRPLRAAGYRVHRYLPLPDVAAPDLLLPLTRTAPADYALRLWRPAANGAKRARNRTVATLVGLGALPAVRPLQVAGVHDDRAPYLLQAAGSLGVPEDADWFMTLGQGDALTRAVFHLFRHGSREPEWILKFARVPGHDEPFRRDERGLALALAAGDTVAGRAPRLLGRSECDGLPFSVETAAVGERLSTLLRRPGAEREKLKSIDRVASWLLEVARATACAPDALGPELARLTEVVARWAPSGVPPELVQRLPALRGTLQHNDLGSWNIIGAADGFTVVDWESAVETGLPLWDLLYFLVDTLPLLDGADTAEERADRALTVLRGDSTWSPLLFERLREAAAAMQVPDDAVGPIATLCWLHHGLSHVARGEATRRVDSGTDVALPPVERIAAAWLSDPALGPDWNAWRAGG